MTAVAFALRQVGKPYQWGAAGPGAYDCSGLVFAAYAVAGIHIARTTFGWRQHGPTVPLTEIAPGDLLSSAGSDGTNANPRHVVMYLGGGQIIQARRPARGSAPPPWPGWLTGHHHADVGVASANGVISASSAGEG